MRGVRPWFVSGAFGRGVCAWWGLLRLSSCLSLPCAIGVERNLGETIPEMPMRQLWVALCSVWPLGGDMGWVRGAVP